MQNQQPEDRWFTDGELSLHYLDWGNREATPMVLLHHHAGNARYWDFFARKMKDEYHIVSVDRRGCGDSSWVGDYNARAYLTDLTKLLAAEGLEHMVLIGHSMGGIDAINYTLAHPERVARLVIVDIGPEINLEGLKRFQKRMATLPAAFGSEEEAARRIKLTEPYYSEEFIRHLVRYITKRDESGRVIFKFDPALLLAAPGPPGIVWQDLEKIACPTLVVYGAESELLRPGVARRMAAALPSGSAVEIEHARHNLPGDNPEAFEASVREFLKRLEAK